MKICLPMVAALLGVVLAAAAPVPSSPDNATTALDPPNEALLGVTANSMGTTTNTGTSAQSVIPEYQPGNRLPPPNVLPPLRPVPATQQPSAAPSGPGTSGPPGHSLTGNVAGMAGAVDASASTPIDPYVATLGTPGKNAAR